MLPGKGINSTGGKAYINGYWVDDVVSLQYGHTNMKVPWRGYHQKHISAVADGKVDVAGQIVINFRYPGYLMKAIEAVSGIDTAIRSQFSITKGRLYELIDRIRKATPQERVVLLADAPPESFDLISELLQATIDGSNPGTLESPVELGPGDQWAGNKGFDIDVVYGDEENAFVERIIGVHLTSVGKKIVASAETSAEPLYEAYSFFATRIRTDLTKRDLSLQLRPDASGVVTLGSLV